jgi:hypothetical protein
MRTKVEKEGTMERRAKEGDVAQFESFYRHLDKPIDL